MEFQKFRPSESAFAAAFVHFHMWRAALMAIILAVTVAAAAAQPVATIHGRVIDSTKAFLPGVTVEATPPGGGKAIVAISGPEGNYTLSAGPGTYDVSFRLINFATTVKRGVFLAAGETTSIDATLHLSASAEVVVTGKQTFRNLADLGDPVNDLIGIADAATVGVITAREIERRPFSRAGEILETVPGVVVSQHSGEGKANQYYLRGFNLDHGTDIAIMVAGVPVNMPTHAHGQGYADANFLIPELISGVQYKKGPYYAEEGDFASAGAVNINYLNLLDHRIGVAEGGTFGYMRALFAESPKVGDGYLLYAVESERNNGPWTRPDQYRKLNGILRFSRGDQRSGFSMTAMGYDAKWNSTDQIPERAFGDGLISRFGSIDPTDGGKTHRYSLSSEWQRNSSTSLTQVAAYGIDYRLNLFSNFTYFLDDPVNGDQFEQVDRRHSYGLRASHRWLAAWGGVAAESVIGLQARIDDIGNVALYHTRDRERLSAVRQDDVMQRSGAVYAQASLQWSEHLRTVIGLRGDRYHFRDRADNPLNGGSRESSLVSPKVSVILGPWRNTEFYANAGYGFHSNDGRGATIRVDPSSGDPVRSVNPLVRSKGTEIGFRTAPVPRFHMTASLWALDIASELLFTGDAGTTEASRPSRRTGIEVATLYNLLDWIALDADYAYSRARFSDADPAGNRIPGAVEGVATVGLSLIDVHRFSGELRDRYFGPRPLIENNSVRSKPSNTVNARISYAVTPLLKLNLDLFNIFNAQVSDVDYFYRSRLPGEPAGGVDDIHFHPIEKRVVRLGVSTTF
ncbi:MAG: TonB-dependent receptor [Gemmatimonadota bacterium]|nr:TonB-dependent receptor [Gemmatimonadota bacterium]